MSTLNERIAKELESEPKFEKLLIDCSDLSVTIESNKKLWVKHINGYGGEIITDIVPNYFDKCGNAKDALVNAMVDIGWNFMMTIRESDKFFIVWFMKKKKGFFGGGENLCPKIATQQAVAKALRLEEKDD